MKGRYNYMSGIDNGDSRDDCYHSYDRVRCEDGQLNGGVLDLFESWTYKTPNNIAISFEGKGLSYEMLRIHGNKLAQYLINIYGVESGDIVNVCMPSSHWLIVSLLGVLKSGAAYMPLDPDYPIERLNYFINESQSVVHITVRENLHLFKNHKGRVLLVDDLWSTIEGFSPVRPAVDIDPEDLAYVIYTSGSTGLPKGILQTHKCLQNFVGWQVEDSGIESQLKVMQFAALSFDVSVQEILFSLCSGGCLVLISNTLRKDINRLASFILEQNIELIDVPFSVLNVLLSQGDNLVRATALRHIISAGEPLLMTPDVRAFMDSRPDITLHNHYGPSETHIAFSHSMTAETLTDKSVAPVGKLIRNMCAYILDTSGKPVVEGEIGELYIGGVGVANGYINADLTRQRFLPNPFQQGERFYKTGDYARYLDDGSVDLMGREDDQVKVRGNRVELGEVEHCLLTLAGIEEAAVIARQLNYSHKEIIAYLVCSHDLTVQSVRGWLQGSLPEFMIPSYFVFLDKLPLSPNGKTDRRNLPLPDLLPSDSSRPKTQVPETLMPKILVPVMEDENGGATAEKKLALLWRENLSLSSVGVDDNYFMLGGDSLKAVRLVSAIGQLFNMQLYIEDLFSYPTVAQLAAYMEKREDNQVNHIPVRVEVESGCYEISHNQKRLWLGNELAEISNTAYSIGIYYQLQGLLNIEFFTRSIDELCRRHESLRTSFITLDGQPWQKVGEVSNSVLFKDVSGSKNAEADALRLVESEAEKPFNLEEGQLFRCVLIKVADEHFISLFLMHHIISDAWSVDVLLRELKELYRYYIQACTVPTGPENTLNLPELAIQYKDFSAWQNKALREGLWDVNKAFWQAHLSDADIPLSLPIDRPRKSVQGRKGEIVSVNIEAEHCQQLDEMALQTGSTLFMILLAAVKVLLLKYTGQQQITTGSPISGREHPDLEHQVGFYVNTVAIRDIIDSQKGFIATINQVKQSALNAYDNGIYPFDLLVDEMEIIRQPGRHPLFDVWVVLHDQLYREFELDGDKLIARQFDAKVEFCLFDLSFQFYRRKNSVLLELQFNSELYDLDTIELMADRFHDLVQQLCQFPTVAIEALSLD